MDPESTGPEGAHALVALLRDRGVDVVVANDVDERRARRAPGSLLLFAESQHVADRAAAERLADTPGDLLLVEPTSRAREALAPGIRLRGQRLGGAISGLRPARSESGRIGGFRRRRTHSAPSATRR